MQNRLQRVEKSQLFGDKTHHFGEHYQKCCYLHRTCFEERLSLLWIPYCGVTCIQRNNIQKPTWLVVILKRPALVRYIETPFFACCWRVWKNTLLKKVLLNVLRLIAEIDQMAEGKQHVLLLFFHVLYYLTHRRTRKKVPAHWQLVFGKKQKRKTKKLSNNGTDKNQGNHH